jgi:hypothetical protein
MSFFQILASYFCTFLVCCFTFTFPPMQPFLSPIHLCRIHFEIIASHKVLGFKNYPPSSFLHTATPRNKSQDVSTQLTFALIRRTHTSSGSSKPNPGSSNSAGSSSTVLYATIPSSSFPTSSSWGSSSPESPRGTPLKVPEVL